MRLLLVGAAGCVADDLTLVAGVSFDVVMAVNRGALAFRGELHHLVSYHPEILAPLCDERLRLGLPGTPATHCYFSHPDVHHVWPFAAPMPGLSGLFALKVAVLGLKAAEVVLAGMPMTPELGRYDAPASEPEAIFAQDRMAWREFHRDCLQRAGAPRVFSCSGWTAELLGRFAPESFAPIEPAARTRASGGA